MKGLFIQTEYLIFLLVELSPWLKWLLHLFFCNLVCHRQKRCWFCSHFLDRSWEACCWSTPLFFFSLIVSSSTNPQFILWGHPFENDFHCGTWWLSKQIITCDCGLFDWFFLFFVAPTEWPVGFSSWIVVNLNAGLVTLSDVVLISSAHYFNLMIML